MFTKLEKKKNKKINSPNKPDFQLNEKVLLKTDPLSSAIDNKTKKLMLVYEGPYLIKKIIHFDTFLIKELNTNKERGIFNRKYLKKYFTRD